MKRPHRFPNFTKHTVRPRLEALEDRTCPSPIPTLSASVWTPIGPAPVNAPGVELGQPVGRTVKNCEAFI